MPRLGLSKPRLFNPQHGRSNTSLSPSGLTEWKREARNKHFAKLINKVRGSSPKLETLTLFFLMAHISHLLTDLAAWMGEEFGGEGIHMYVWLKLHTFHCSPETITTLLISNTPIQTKKLLKKIFNSCKERAPKWCVLHEPKSDLDEWMAHRWEEESGRA